MTDPHIYENPYSAERPNLAETLAPFAGRDDALARLHQHLSDANTARAVGFLGRRRAGKSSFLRHFAAVAGPGLVPVYISLGDTPLRTEALWLQTLGDALCAETISRGFRLAEIPEPEDSSGLREWMTAVCLPEVFRAIRPQRRLVILLDDGHVLARAVENDHQPQDCFAFLYGLLGPQFDIALTVDLEYESELDRFFPLVESNDMHRINLMNAAVCERVLREPAAGHYTLTDDAVAAIFDATGGEPALLQRFGAAVYARGTSTAGSPDITPEVVRALMPDVYVASSPEFQLFWKGLNRDERLVLTALSNLLYDDPLAEISVGKVEAWLVETDHPLDITAINAAVRGLEYHELVRGTASAIRINAGLMRKWLLEHARLSEKDITLSREPEESSRNRLIVFAAIIVLVAVVLALTLLGGTAENNTARNTPLSTVTLQSGG